MRRRVAGCELELLVEHAAHFTMVSIFHCLYWYVQNIAPNVLKCGENVQKEVEAFRQVMVLARSSSK